MAPYPPACDPNVYSKSKQPKSGSGKERATDIPSWAKGQKPNQGESGKDFADRVMKQRYPDGNYPKGPGKEFNKLKKFGDRAFKKK